MVSYVGMVTQEVAIKQNVKVILESDVEHLDEVMVVAFGTAKKSQFTGSAATIKADKITERQVSNVSNALSGQIAGVQTTATNGEPGASANVRIRGIGSMSASNAPLYVVDGVPFEGNIATINPQDIETMTVLKDAASNALYGARGANGVILITTKKGQSGAKAKIDVDAKWGTNRRAIPNYDVMTNPDMYYETYYQGINNALGGNAASDKVGAYVQQFLGYPIYNIPEGEQLFTAEGKINPNASVGNKYVGSDGKEYYLQPDNWYNELFMNNNMRQEYNVRISGASPQSTYFLSAGYLEDTGIIPNSGFQRFSARMNADYQVNNRIKVGSSFSYANTNSLSPRDQSGSSSGNLFYISNMIAPIYPLYVRNADGSIKIDDYGFTTYDFGAGEYPGLGRPFMGNSNPASMIALDKYKTVSDVLSGRAFLNWEIAKGLKASANWGVDVNNSRNNNLYNTYYGQYSATGGIIYVTAARTFSTNQQYLLTYNREFGNHSFDALAGYENYQRTYQYLSASKENLYNPNVPEIDNAISQPSASSYTGVYNTQGILARLQYDYADKYYASMSYRRDGSSRFHKDNRWGNFWSFGGSWRVSEEEFMKDLTWLNSLKLRASYGETGNDDIYIAGYRNYYPYQSLYQLGFANGLENGVYIEEMANVGLKWETQVSMDAAIEFGLFDRLTGTVEYFNKQSRDLLFDVSQPASMGVTSIVQNIGKVSNSGVEIDLSYDVIKSKDWNLTIGANATFIKNKIEELPEEMKKDGYIDGSKKWFEGKSIYEFWLRQWYGVDPDTGNGLYYADVENHKETDKDYAATLKTIDGKILTNDYNYAKYDYSGASIPKVYGGFNFRLGYKDFDLAATFSYQLGGHVLDTSYAGLMSASEYGYSMSPDIKNAWKQPGDVTDVPRLDANSTHNSNVSQSYSTRWLTSSDYLNLRSVSLGYNVPKSLLSKIALKNARLNLTCENVFMIKARQGLNPQANFTGLTYNEYMPARTFTIGLNVGF